MFTSGSYYQGITVLITLTMFLGLTGIIGCQITSYGSSSVSLSSFVKQVMAEQVTAQVILKTREGLSILDTNESITSENVEAYRVDDATIQQVSKELTRYGFQVGQPGPYSISITGDKSLFEQVFQTQLERRSASSTLELGASSYYEALNPLQIPEELSNQIAGITLSRLPELFS